MVLQKSEKSYKKWYDVVLYFFHKKSYERSHENLLKLKYFRNNLTKNPLKKSYKKSLFVYRAISYVLCRFKVLKTIVYNYIVLYCVCYFQWRVAPRSVSEPSQNYIQMLVDMPPR